MKKTHNLIILLIILFISVFSSFPEAKTFEDLDPEYCISEVQADFPPWWEEEWEETVTGFRIRGSSFDLHTLHTLQHWKGRFPFNEYFLFAFNYFTDAGVDSQFYRREIELKYRIRRNNYISLFGFPYYDKKESDIGIRFSIEETPFDFVKFSILFENAPNNYTFKDRDMDSMRIYKKQPILYSFDISIIRREPSRLIISYNMEPENSANYENRDKKILYKTESEKSDISMTYRYSFADTSKLGGGLKFFYMKKRYLSPEGVIDSTRKYVRFNPYIYLNKSINPFYNLIIIYNSELEDKPYPTSIKRKAILLGIVRNFSTHSKLGLSYCNGITDYVMNGKKRRDNRLILSAEHRFRNKAEVGLNLGLELDTRDTTHGWLGRYDKLFLFLQYPIR